MTELYLNPSNGVFDPPVLRDLAGAFEKADRHIDRLRPSGFGTIDRDSVARQILFEAQAGETQPDLVWRAAVAKVLLEARAAPVKATRESEAEMPPAGPHASPRHTNDDATPGAGALPADTAGGEVDPATG